MMIKTVPDGSFGARHGVGVKGVADCQVTLKGERQDCEDRAIGSPKNIK